MHLKKFKLQTVGAMMAPYFSRDYHFNEGREAEDAPAHEYSNGPLSNWIAHVRRKVYRRMLKELQNVQRRKQYV